MMLKAHSRFDFPSDTCVFSILLENGIGRNGNQCHEKYSGKRYLKKLRSDHSQQKNEIPDARPLQEPQNNGLNATEQNGSRC